MNLGRDVWGHFMWARCSGGGVAGRVTWDNSGTGMRASISKPTPYIPGLWKNVPIHMVGYKSQVRSDPPIIFLPIINFIFVIISKLWFKCPVYDFYMIKLYNCNLQQWYYYKNSAEGVIAPAGAKVTGATIRMWLLNKFISFLAVLGKLGWKKM